MEQQAIKDEIRKLLKEYSATMQPYNPTQVPVSGKKFDEQELYAVMDALLEGHWTEGIAAAQFEQKFTKFLGTRFASIVNSGSSANLAAVRTLCSPKLKERQLKSGDEVITVAAGFPTTVNPIILSGCTPVFCDVEIGTYSVKIDQLKAAVSSKTKAVIMAHTLGNPFNIREVMKVCRDNNLWLIEDNCDALGSKYDGKYTGTFGHLSTFSFYPAHQITMGEGGAVCTSDAQLARISRSIRDWGRDCFCGTGKDNTCGKRFSWKLGELPYGYDHKYIYSELGFNLKTTDLNIAIGLAQLDKLPDFISARRRNFAAIHKELAQYEDLLYLPKAEENSEPCWFGFPITLKENCSLTRPEILKFLEEHGVATRLLFAGNLAKQPYFIDNKIQHRIARDLDNTDVIMNNCFWVGVCPLIDEPRLAHLIEVLHQCLGGH